MTGKYNGVEDNILQENEFAIFVPCSVQSLNLLGINTNALNYMALSFFGIVQIFFTFFKFHQSLGMLMSTLRIQYL
jgi:hypothetical protein